MVTTSESHHRFIYTSFSFPTSSIFSYFRSSILHSLISFPTASIFSHSRISSSIFHSLISCPTSSSSSHSRSSILHSYQLPFIPVQPPPASPLFQPPPFSPTPTLPFASHLPTFLPPPTAKHISPLHPVFLDLT
jgi:hypothetical protein